MYSSYGNTKVEVLQIMFDEGYFDSCNLFNILESFNNLNKQLGIEHQIKNNIFWKLSRNAQTTLKLQYETSFPDWKCFKREAYNTNINMLSGQDKTDFETVDKLLANIMVCKRVCELHQFTGGNPVQISFEDMRAIKYVLHHKDDLAYFQFEFKV